MNAPLLSSIPRPRAEQAGTQSPYLTICNNLTFNDSKRPNGACFWHQACSNSWDGLAGSNLLHFGFDDLRSAAHGGN